MTDVEQLLQRALRPVEPPSNLGERLESRLTEIADAAAEELADWELSTMRDPRNWGRPAGAAAAGVAAGGALLLIRARRQQQQKGAQRRASLERAAREFADETMKRLGRS